MAKTKNPNTTTMHNHLNKLKMHPLPNILYWLIAASLLLPLFVWQQTIAPFHFGKVILFRLLVEVMVVLWVWLMVRDASYRPWHYPWRALIPLLVTLFVGVVVLTGLAGVDAARSFWGTFERMGGVFTFLHYLAWFWIVLTVVRTREHWERLLKISLGASVLSAGYALLQFTTTFPEWVQGEEMSSIVGTIGNAALFSGYILVHIFLALWLALRFIESSEDDPRNQHRWESIGYLVIAVFLAVVLWIAGVRASIAGVVFGLAVMALLLPCQAYGRPWIKKVVAIFLLLAVTGGVAVTLLPSHPLVVAMAPESVRQFDLGAHTVQTRVWAWGATWKSILGRPLLGWGAENAAFAFNANFNPSHYSGPGSETWFDRAHNVFLDVTVAHGGAGLAVFIALLFVVFCRMNRIRRREPVLGAALIGLLVAYLIHDAWILDTFANYLMLLLLFGFVSEAQGSSTKAQVREIHGMKRRRFRESKMGVVIVIVTIMVMTSSAWANVRAVQANRTTVQAMTTGGKSLEQTLQHYDRALSYGYSGRAEALFQLALYAIRLEENDRLLSGKLDANDRLVFGSAVEPERRRDTLLFSSRHLQEFLDNHPQEAQLQLFLGRTYNMLAAQYDRRFALNAERTLEQGIAASPTRPRFHQELAQTYLHQGRGEDAVRAYDRAVRLNPRVAVSWWYAGLAKALTAREQEGIADIEHALALGLNVANDDLRRRQITTVYTAAGREAELQTILERQ